MPFGHRPFSGRELSARHHSCSPTVRMRLRTASKVSRLKERGAFSSARFSCVASRDTTRHSDLFPKRKIRGSERRSEQFVQRLVEILDADDTDAKELFEAFAVRFGNDEFLKAERLCFPGTCLGRQYAAHFAGQSNVAKDGRLRRDNYVAIARCDGSDDA